MDGGCDWGRVQLGVGGGSDCRRMPVIITVMLQVAQQFSGINCVRIDG